MAIEIVDFPLKMVIFHSYVSLPEGTLQPMEMVLGPFWQHPKAPWGIALQMVHG